MKNGHIYFNHNAANAIDSISVGGTGVSPNFSVSPTSLNFGNVNNGTTKMDSVTVSNNGTASLIISSITSTNTVFTVNPANGVIIPGATQKFYVTFAPLTNGLKNAYIIFNHNAASAKDSISVSGTGVTGALPIFSVSPISLNFGNVNNGITKMDSVTVTNTGTANLIISTVTSTNVLFVATPTNGIIVPGATQKFYVAFTPLTNGLKNGYIIFNHNALNVKDSITVSGTGVSPTFSISPASLNFGNVNNTTTKMDSVTVTNTGTANLIISSVTSTNTVFTVTPTTGVIAPGLTQKFYVTFAPLTNGLKNGFIVFNHNAANVKDSISVSGTGVTGASPYFSVSPTSLNFGNVNISSTKMDSVTVTNIGTANLIISSVTSSNTVFTVTPTIGLIIPGATQKFYVTFTPLTNGLKNGYIVFNHNAANAKDSISVSGTGVSSSFLVNPSSLSFGNVNNGTTKMDSVTVTNTGTTNLIISSVTSTNSVFTVTPTIGIITPGLTQKFYVTFAPLTNGLKNGYIIFNHNAGNGLDSVAVSGTGISPAFSVSPTSLNFGNVTNGTMKLDSVTVTNTGTANLIISTVTSTNILFSVTPITGIILPGATKKFYVTFAPLTNGLKNGYIVFNHNAANVKDSVSVSGTGVTAPLPIFSVSPTSLNFGNVTNGTTKLDSVTVTNTGTSNLMYQQCNKF